MLPALIEIVPPALPVSATVVLPGSKSLTNRALILAALAHGPVTLRGALWSEDTQAMTHCLRVLGFTVTVADDASEPANRTITVEGCGGEIPLAGTAEAPLELFVENAGTAARFLAALVCMGRGTYRLSGVDRMHQRPQAALFCALRELGYTVETPNDFLPAVITGSGSKQGASCHVSVAESSQFASALILCQNTGGWQIEVTGANEDELPYVDMTRRLVDQFPSQGGVYDIEPDASGASYFWGADWLLRDSGSSIRVDPAPVSGMQADQRFHDLIVRQPWKPSYSRATDLADSIMTAIVLAPFAPSVTTFTDLGRLRVQECERVAALRTELGKCGARVEEHGDTLTIHPSPWRRFATSVAQHPAGVSARGLHGAGIATYNDHRIAMCFAMLALRVPGIRLQNPSCVKKTFPNFFQKLASLGATVLDAGAGKPLAGTELHAD